MNTGFKFTPAGRATGYFTTMGIPQGGGIQARFRRYWRSISTNRVTSSEWD